MSGERKGVVYNAGDHIVADLFYPHPNNAYNDSTGVYTAENDHAYILDIFYLSNSSEETLAFVIDGVTQPRSVWNRTSGFRHNHGAHWHALRSKKFDMNQGQRWWFRNTVNSTKYFDFSWTLYAPKP